MKRIGITETDFNKIAAVVSANVAEDIDDYEAGVFSAIILDKFRKALFDDVPDGKSVIIKVKDNLFS